MIRLECKYCEGEDFFALETVAAMTPVAFYGERDKEGRLMVEIEESGTSQFVHDNATSIVNSYLCANEDCNKVTVAGDFVLNLKES